MPANPVKRSACLITRRPPSRALGNTKGAWRHDQHHCRCYSIDKSKVRLLWDGLRSLGFERQMLEKDHGQAWGLRLKTSENEQIHIKAMPDGRIESEMEPQPEYPADHLNQARSYSPHRYLGHLLRELRIPFRRVRVVPPTCWRPVIDRPENPIRWEWFAIAVLGFAGLLAYALWGRRS